MLNFDIVFDEIDCHYVNIKFWGFFPVFVQVTHCGVVENILDWVKVKTQVLNVYSNNDCTLAMPLVAGHFAERHFAERTVCRTDSLPTNNLTNGECSARCLSAKCPGTVTVALRFSMHR
jgi:hypothetical protein